MTLSEIERATEGLVIARRNMAVGLWAGKIIGLKGRALESYVLDVMRADHDMPGPDDVIDKITRDFIDHGIDFEEREIGQQIERQERLTRLEMGATDKR
jgi:hypothetical protein